MNASPIIPAPEPGAVTEVESGLCRALGHPLRLQLLFGLLGGECDVGVMQEKSRADQPTVSKHLAVLREARLVEVRVEGRRRCYSLSHPELTRALLENLQQLGSAVTDNQSGTGQPGTDQSGV